MFYFILTKEALTMEGIMPSGPSPIGKQIQLQTVEIEKQKEKASLGKLDTKKVATSILQANVKPAEPIKRGKITAKFIDPNSPKMLKALKVATKPSKKK